MDITTYLQPTTLPKALADASADDETLTKISSTIEGCAAEASAVFSELRTEVARGNGSVRDTRRIVAIIKESIRELANDLEDHRRTVSKLKPPIPPLPYVDRLSDDLLQEIFIQVTDSLNSPRCSFSTDDNDLLKSMWKPHEQETIALVSKRWRGIALSTGVLWNRLKIEAGHSPARTHRWLILSRSTPLYLWWDLWNDPQLDWWDRNEFDNHVEVLQPDLTRIKYLSLCQGTDDDNFAFPEQLMDRFLNPLAVSTSLTHLVVHGQLDNGKILDVIGAFPNLVEYKTTLRSLASLCFEESSGSQYRPPVQR